ncbi:unnamed protein product [Leptidea sinapis]|uniref:Protein krueppel n=1 Tax=Leptidea sinapis TaxID=189913 RepID=A0A5E4Q5N8_9NEOP|nr:unnamed protein product [Leptidea sinapis]
MLIMRTYSRKPVQHKNYNGLLDLCRLCLQKVSKPVPLFDERIDNNVSLLPARIMICLGLEITRDENLPNMICSQCYQDLDNYYSFKTKCLLSNEKLHAYVLATRDIENRKEDLELKISNICSLQCTLPELDGESGSNELDDDDIVLALTDEDALEVINIFRQTTACSGDEEDEEDERVQSVSTSYHINESLDFLNSASESPPPIPEDIPGYLSTILVQLGVFIKKDEQIKVIDKSFRNVQLDTEEGSVTLEIVEVEHPPPKQGLQDFLDREIEDDSDINFVYNANPGIRDTISCETCGKQFSRRGALVRHERVHSGAKPFVCRICQRAFSQKEVLRRHEHTHKAQRPHACSACDKSFAQPASLRAHRQTAHATQPRPLLLHPCNICSKVYLHASGLCRHMWTHEGRLFSCADCGKSFRDKSSLLRHIKTVGAHNHPNTDQQLKTEPRDNALDT